MNQVTTALTPEQIAGVEAREKNQAVAAPQAAAPANPPRFLDSPLGEREVSYTLLFPIEWEGREITEVLIRRPTMREWRDYARRCADASEKGGPAAVDQVDMPWISVPAAVIESLDFHDASMIEAKQQGFFARSSLPQEGVTGTEETLSNESPLPLE